MSSHRLAPVLAALVCAPLIAVAPLFAAEDPAGSWSGEIVLPGQGLGVLVVLERDGAGQWHGTIDIPVQGALDLPLRGIEIEGESVRFSIAGVPGDPTFDGRLGQGEISGTFRQSGAELPFRLTRGEAVPSPPRPQEPKPPFPYVEEAVEVALDGHVLRGTLTLPQGEEAAPGVVLLTGSGPQDRDEEIFGHRPFWVLADHLTRAGIAVLRLDDRGVGESTGEFASATTEDFVTDAAAAVRYLRERPEVDASAVGLLGHSEGGLIATILAARSREVAFVVLLAGPGVVGREVLVLQNRRLLETLGVPAESIETQLELLAAALDLVASGASFEEVRQAAADLAAVQLKAQGAGIEPGEPEFDALVDGATQQFLSPWFRYFLSADPAVSLRQLRVPVLALNGSLDLQVDAGQNLTAIESAVRAGGNTDVTAMTVEGVNHLFQRAQTGLPGEYALLQETISPEVLDAIRDWIDARFGAGAIP